MNIDQYSFRSVPGVFGNQQGSYLDVIKQMLQQSLTDATNYNVSLYVIVINLVITLSIKNYERTIFEYLLIYFENLSKS